ETNIGKLFAAGVLPGILATLLLCLAVQYVTLRDPKAGPRGERTGWRERWSTIAGLQWFLAVGIAIWLAVRFGWIESDNAAVIGAFVVFLMSLHYKGVSSVLALFALVVAAIMVIYVVVGTAMEELSIILLTVPLFFPLIVHMGLDPVWFGILIVVVVEIGLISPPVGMNLFVLNTLLPQVPTRTIFRGVLPFMAADCIRLAILVAFPVISTYLPGMMK